MSANRTAASLRELQPAGPDLSGIKAKQQATWASGDFAIIGTTCRSSVSPSPRRSTCARESVSSTSLRETATRPWRPPVALAM
jgi:hypothetical protein